MVRFCGVLTLPLGLSTSAMPKSHSTLSQLLASLIRMLAGLMSLWMMPALCISLSAIAVLTVMARMAWALPLMLAEAALPSGTNSNNSKFAA